MSAEPRADHEPSADRPADPPVVPGYTLHELLGRGGSGEVWRATPRGGGAAVAVKVLLDGDPEHQAREAALLGEVVHPHLVRLHEVVHQPRRGADARVVLVLDLLEGGSLAALLARRGRLHPGEVVTAIAPIAAALAAAHDRGVIHSDLSPANIVFTAEGRPVLTDLGMARVLGEEFAGGVTPAYVDPTVARGGAPGPASDVFGVAAAAFHALTGVPPWNAATPVDRLAVAATGSLPDLAELAPEAPRELLAVIGRGLAAHPHERGSAAAFALDLRHACRPEPVRLAGRAGHRPELGDPSAGTELTHIAPTRPAAVGPGEAMRDAGRRLDRRVGQPFVAVGQALRRVAVVPRVGAGVAVGVLALGVVVWVVATRGEVAAGDDPRVVAAVQDAAADPAAPPVHRSAEPTPVGSSTQPTVLPSPSSGGSQATPSSAKDWTAVVAELYRRRAAAFTTGSAELLTEVYIPSSAQLAADREALDSLSAAGAVLRGYGPAVVRVTGAATVAPGRVEVRLVDSWSAYDVVRREASGSSVVTRVPARGELPVRMTLVATRGGWRLEGAERVPADA